MEGNDDWNTAQGQERPEIALVRIQERMRAFSRELRETQDIAKGANSLAAQVLRETEDLRKKLESLVRVLNDDRLVILVRMMETYQGDDESKKKFDENLKLSVITLIFSVLAFSVLAPLIQHWLIH